ncbi:MAG: NtaA/DmoA family FMN-dependent monooxygenase [Mycetocola sp.]
MSRLQHFGWFLSRGFGPHGWGQSSHDWGDDWRRPQLYQQSVRDLERAGFDILVIEDALSLGNPQALDLRVSRAYGGPKHDPLMLSPYLLDATEHLGVVPTINPMSLPPYTAARQLATLNHLSNGRFGANVVTDVGSSRHFGLDPLPHDGAYDRAAEWLSGIRELWGSWQDGALVADTSTGRYADGSLLDHVQHRGEYYSFDGPLNAVPRPEGDPVIVSPGGSPRGLDFAGTNSDVQLALARLEPERIRAYRAKVHDAASRHGRTPDEIKVLLVLKPVLVSSHEEAERLVRASASPDESALLQIALAHSSDLETDLTVFDLDSPLDPAVFGDHVSRGSIAGLRGHFDDFAEATLRQVLAQHARLGLLSDRGGLVGTAEELADAIEELGDEADNDGFLLSGDLHPVTVHRYLDELVPVLRRRGVLRREYGTSGLRGNLRDF